MLEQTDTQVNHLASVIDRAGNITNFTENRESKSFFFLKTQKRRVFLIIVSVIKRCIRKISHNRENELLLARVFFLDLY